ncbi:peroxide stress protein YaaA [Lacticaseibacillus kribbianus]|uniref:peroxide stress protein YaaA n=1 Tax=Lacticaseibacillus kribbianus TaxID=2926292 RepID=UPI001CD46778|nr:peroxide stress protein YaaA [Lacticaseibacillus kribbianus]
MQIIISPAKRMVQDLDSFVPVSRPMYIEEATTLLAAMKRLSRPAAQALWRCSDRVADAAYKTLQNSRLDGPLTPALMSFVGLQYQAMAPDLFTAPALDYVQTHLRILSGLYGVLRPFDGVVPYRLSLDEALAVGGARNLYDFWGARLHAGLAFGPGTVLDLASVEYSRAVTPYLTPGQALVPVVFGRVVGGRVRVQATHAKQARGAMVRFLAEHQVTALADVAAFDDPRYRFDAARSDRAHLVFTER